MRFIVLLFGFIGCLLTALLSGIVIFQGPAHQELKDVLQDNMKYVDFLFSAIKQDDFLTTGLFLLLSAALGFLGTLIAFFRLGWQGALLMLIPLIGPGILNPVTLVGTALQAFTGLISMFIHPLPINAGEDDED